MTARFRKPEVLPLVFILCATGMLCALGAWQVARLQWKSALISEIAAAQGRPILGTLPESLTGLEYRRAVLTGRFLHEKQRRMAGGKQGLPSGYFILTPFVLEDDGRILLINRGFAPEGKESKPEGLVTLEGVLRPPRQKRFFSPANHPDKNLWFYEDLAAISRSVGMLLLPAVMEATGRSNGAYPIPHDGQMVLRNDHLGYAVTWFALAAVGLIMFALYHRQKP